MSRREIRFPRSEAVASNSPNGSFNGSGAFTQEGDEWKGELARNKRGTGV